MINLTGKKIVGIISTKKNSSKRYYEQSNHWLRFLTNPKKRSLVLDPFAGSNTTGYAASQNKRRWISIEKNKDYTKGSKGRFIKSL